MYTLVMKKKACIVLPTYNEVENIPIILNAIFSQGERIVTHELHVLVVDDDSPVRRRLRVHEPDTDDW